MVLCSRRHEHSRHFNPFTACYACRAVTRKTTNKMAKLELTKAFPPCAGARERNSIKMRSTKSRFVKGHQLYCLQECMRALFSPETLQAGSVKGLTVLLLSDHYSVAARIRCIYPTLLNRPHSTTTDLGHFSIRFFKTNVFLLPAVCFRSFCTSKLHGHKTCQFFNNQFFPQA